MTAESLSRVLEEFLGGSRHAMVLEEGARIFDLADSKYSVSGEYNKCLLHLWSAERNVVRPGQRGPQWQSAPAGAVSAVEAGDL